MSIYAYDWVRTYSTAEGATHVVHLHIADSVSAATGWRYAHTISYLAAACRCSERTARSALRWLEDHGYIRLAEDNSREGGRTPNVYEFLLPAGLPAVYDATTSTGAPTADTPLSPGRAEIEALREDDE